MTDAKKLFIKERETELIELTTGFCEKYLDEEFSMLCEKMIEKLGRKRDVPFAGGGSEIWAAAVIHALGTINFLFDKSFEPFVTVDDINNYFGTKKSSSSNKSRDIRNMLKLNYFDDEFSISAVKENNPINDMVMVDDLIVTLDALPPEYQQMVREARAGGEDISFRTKK